MPRALWAKAPLALLRHRVGLLAVVAVSLLVGVGAAAGPLMNAGAESEALRSKLRQLTPLAAGLSINRPVQRGRGDKGDAKAIAAADQGRRRAAVALGSTLPSVGRPVLTTSTYTALAGPAFDLGNPVVVVPMARTDATAHVQRIAGDGAGAWLSSAVEHRAGGVVSFGLPGARKVSLPVGAIYRSLDRDLGNPYWVNFMSRIRSSNPDPPPLPSFVLVTPAQLYRLASAAGGSVGNDFEFPVAVQSMTPSHAKQVARSFDDVKQALAERSGLAQRLGCADVDSPCMASSALTDAVRLAAAGNSSLQPVIDLLAGFCVLVALGAALIAGVFTGRRRAAEGRLSLVGGEPRHLFFARAGIESFLPSVIGAAAGFAIAVELVRLFTPDGSIDDGVVSAGRRPGGRVGAGVRLFRRARCHGRPRPARRRPEVGASASGSPGRPSCSQPPLPRGWCSSPVVRSSRIRSRAPTRGLSFFSCPRLSLPRSPESPFACSVHECSVAFRSHPSPASSLCAASEQPAGSWSR